MKAGSSHLGFFVVALAISSWGCGGAALRAAKDGDQRELAAAIRTKIDDGSLTRNGAARIAEAVAEREIKTAQGDAGVDRIRDLRACARDLDDVLEDRERAGDAAAVEAAWARAFYGDLSPGDARDYQRARDPRMQAIAPLGFVRDDDADARRKAFVDPRAEARRAAMRASERAQDRGDIPGLAEAARLDPDLLVRSEALRALLSFGGTDVAVRLRDLWTAGDEGIRGDIAVGWTRPSLFPHGGEQALRVIIAEGRGPGAIEAAAAILRAPKSREGGASASGELRASAIALLARTAERDAKRGRLHALATVPVSGDAELAPILTAVKNAVKDDDLEIRVTALSRLLDLPERDPARGPAVTELEVIAGRNHGKQSRRALFALAVAGHRRIQAWVEKELASDEPEARVSALMSLIALERAPRGAGLLADKDPSVRTRSACLLMAAARRR